MTAGTTPGRLVREARAALFIEGKPARQRHVATRSEIPAAVISQIETDTRLPSEANIEALLENLPALDRDTLESAIQEQKLINRAKRRGGTISDLIAQVRVCTGLSDDDKDLLVDLINRLGGEK